MVNSKRLKQKIRDSGYRVDYVAKVCGLSYYGFLQKMSGKHEFKASEIKAVAKLLRLTDQEIREIFFND